MPKEENNDMLIGYCLGIAVSVIIVLVSQWLDSWLKRPSKPAEPIEIIIFRRHDDIEPVIETPEETTQNEA